MAIATAPRSRTSAALAPVMRVFTAVSTALSVCIEVYRDAMARRSAFFERNPHISQD
ncbi:MAG: hypothetical protein JJU21_09155 [Salinarimonas sp.]|nr:hypothetical protein [Salinarimonas sp.]